MRICKEIETRSNLWSFLRGDSWHFLTFQAASGWVCRSSGAYAFSCLRCSKVSSKPEKKTSRNHHSFPFQHMPLDLFHAWFLWTKTVSGIAHLNHTLTSHSYDFAANTICFFDTGPSSTKFDSSTWHDLITKKQVESSCFPNNHGDCQVPGPDHDDDDDADPPENPEKVKSKEANLNVVNAGSEASPPRTPRALKVPGKAGRHWIRTTQWSFGIFW